LTREKLIAELNKLRDFNPGIQSGALSFTPEQHAGIRTGKVIYMPGTTPKIVSKYPGDTQ
jgi:branched-chain amino acid transport system substrate-binding protein